MFEFNGKQYSLEQLQNIAEKKGYTFEELLQKNPTIKELKQGPVLIENKSPVGGFFGEQAKTNAVAEPVATATAKQLLATDTALPSVNGSLESKKPKEITVDQFETMSLDEKKQLSYKDRQRLIAEKDAKAAEKNKLTKSTKPPVVKISTDQALFNYEQRTGKKANSLMDLADEDYDPTPFELRKFKPVDKVETYKRNRDRLNELQSQREKLEKKAVVFSYETMGGSLESVDYVKETLKEFDKTIDNEVKIMDLDPDFKLRKEAIIQLSRNSNNTRATGDAVSDLSNEFSILNTFRGRSYYKNLESTETIDLNDEVEDAVINSLDERSLQKLAGGFYTLEEKENIITNAKIPLIQEKEKQLYGAVEKLTRETEVKINGYSKEINNINSLMGDILKGKQKNEQGKYILNEEDSKAYNILVNKYQEVTDKIKSAEENYDYFGKDALNKFNLYQGDLGIDLAKQTINNNFKLSNDADKFRESYAGDGFWNATGDIVGGELIQGLYQTLKKATVGSVAWVLSSFGDLFQDQDNYSSFDAFRDVVGNWTNNTLVPQSTDEKFKITKEEGGFKDFNARNYTKLGFGMVPFTGYLISEVRKGNYTGLKDAIGRTYVGLGAKGKVLPQASQKLKDNIIMADAAFRATILDNQKQAEDLGLKGLQANAYATAISTTEALVQSIMPDTQFLKGVSGKAIKESFAGTLKSVANKEGIKSAVKEFSTGILKEYAEEEITLGANILTDASFGLALPKASEFLNQQIELTMGTLMLSSSMGSVGAKNTFSNQKKIIYNQIAENAQSLELHLMTMYKNTNNEENKNKLFDAIIFARDIKKAVESSPENVTSEQIDLLVEKSKLIEKREKTDPAFYSEIDDKIKKIDEDIKEGGVKRDILLKIEQDKIKGEKFSKAVFEGEVLVKAGSKNEVIDKLSEDEIFRNMVEEELSKKKIAVDENKFNEIVKIKAKDFIENGGRGFILQAEEGSEQSIFVNEDIAFEESATDTNKHEVLHSVLKSFIKNSPNLGKKLVDYLQTQLGEAYYNTEFSSRFDQYNDKYINELNTLNNQLSENKITEEEYNAENSKAFESFYEESMPLLAEAFAKGDIKDNSTFVTKFKDFFNNIFISAGLKKLKLDSGEDVFNFVRNYSNIYETGRGFKTIKKITEGAVEGELINTTKIISKVNEIKPSLSKKQGISFSLSGKNFTEKDKTDLFSTTNKKFNEAAELYGLDIKLKEDGTPDFTKQQWDALDNNTKLGLGFLIGENFSPYVSYLMGSRRDVPGFDELAPQIIERVSTGLEKGDDGIPFLVKTYDPSKGTKLTTHIFGQIARRLQGVIDKTAGFGKMTVEAAPTESGRRELISEETAEFEIEKEERAKTETQKEFSKIADEIIVLDEKQGTVSIGKKVADEVKRSVKVAYATMKFKNEIGTKEFRTELANAMRNKLGNLFREIMDRGVNFDNNKKLTNKEKRDNYDSFVDANFKNMYSIMPKSTIADRFPFLMEPIKNEDGTLYSMSVAEVDAYNDAIDRGEIRGKKIANKYANNKAYKKKDYSSEVKKEGTEYLKANDKATNVRNARKVSFADVIAEEAAFDVLPEILIENNLAPEAAILEIQKQIGRVKFSLGLNDAEKNIFDDHSDAFFKDLLQVKNLNTKNIKRILKYHYKPNLLPEEKLQSIAKQFAGLLKPVSKIEITERESIKDIKEYIIDIVTQVDGFKTLAQLTGVKEGIEALFRNPLELKIAREATVELMQEIIDNNENLSLDQKVSLIYTFANSTFNSSGLIGIFKYDKTVEGQFKSSERTGNYKDLYSGIDDIKDNLFSQLNFGGYKIKSIGNKDIILENLENGKETIKVENEYSASTLITQKMLDGSFEYNDKNAKAAQIFVTSIFENIGNLGLDNSTKAILLATLMDGSSNALRAAAPVWGISTKKPTENYKGVISDIFPALNYKNYVYEHTVPARVAFTYLYDYHINGNKKINIEALWNDYKVTIIPREMDDVINDIGFKSITTSDYFPGGDVPWSNRYYNLFTRGKIQSTIQSWGGDPEIIGQGYEKYFKEAGAKTSIKAEAATEVKVIQNAERAIENASKIPFSLSSKGISVYDFDDTLAFSKSKVIVNQKGKTFKINAAEFAEKGNEILADGGVFDFSEFSKVVDGKAGPLVPRLKKAIEKFGNKNIFVLTARPVDSAPAIYEFLKGLGLEIPIENITGLANSAAQAKANWMVGKVAEGYNDFYFVDDALQNVTAVKEVLDNFDVKGKVQQAKVKFSLNLDKEFNEMIERQKGIESYKEFSKVVAKRRGKAQNRFKFFIPPSAEDFRGLTQYVFAGKGTQGEIDQKFFEESLMNPYFKGIAEMERVKQKVKQDIKGINIMFKPVAKNLGNLIPDGNFTFDAAIRVYLWNKAGYKVPNISKRDNAKLIKLVSEDADLSAYANALLLASRKEKWLEPNEYWDAQTLLTDLNNLTEKQYRKEYLAEFIENANIIFSDKNLNKIEAGYGGSLREAIENALYSMETGTNRPKGGDRITDAWLNWVNNSIGTIMFFNRRSAVLQTISSINFINWSDNNPLKAGLAFANQSQYWKDFSTLFNSDKLKERRSGLKSDVQEQEIANAAKGAKDKAAAIVSYLLKIGFTPTQLADSFAIASGGATFYRNRINTYKKQVDAEGNKLYTEKEAETKAFEDFSKLSDESQQSGDPALVSQQQRSVAGRLILAFQNTTMQYARLIKKASQDLVNKRGDAKTHISKILYYGAVQNIIFTALQNAAFALIPGFDDEDEDEKKQASEDKKITRGLNSMIDTLLRGLGIYGAILATIKNVAIKVIQEDDKGFKGNPANIVLEAANISPPIGSKLRKLHSSYQTYQFDKDVIKQNPWNINVGGKFNPSPTYNIVANISSAAFNIPLDRMLSEIDGVKEALDNRNTIYQRIALAAGWRTWDVGAKNEEFDLIKIEAKATRKKEGIEKSKETRRKNRKPTTKRSLIKKSILKKSIIK